MVTAVLCCACRLAGTHEGGGLLHEQQGSVALQTLFRSWRDSPSDTLQWLSWKTSAGFQQVLKDDAVDSSSDDEDAWAAACATLMLDFRWVQLLQQPQGVCCGTRPCQVSCSSRQVD